MKKNLLLMLAALMSLSALGQNKLDLVIFSEDPEPFYAYVNGVRQNDRAETNVKITGLSPNISLRIVFENKALPELKKSMSLEPGFEHTARIKRDKQQQMKLQYFGQVALEEGNKDVPAVAYHSTENVAPATEAGNASATSVSGTTTTTRTSGTPGEDVSVNVNMAGVGISMNVSGMENSGAAMNSTTSTTITSSSSGSSDDQQSSSPVTRTEAAASPVASGCTSPMSPASFSTMKKSVESKPFSDTKMSTAKVATKNSCLSVAQVKEICKLFSMDEDRLSYAKYAYSYCVDKASFYQVSEVFSFSSTTDEFNAFLEQ